MGSDTTDSTATYGYTGFQSTLPGWGATIPLFPCARVAGISIHAPRMGSDQVPARAALISSGFQSTLPGWGATGWLRSSLPLVIISIHAPRMGSDGRPECHNAIKFISIHAPRMGSDPSRKPNRDRATQISIHAPRMGSDAQVALEGIEIVAFQSTLPGWGATLPFRAGCTMGLNFNPRSPDGERPERGVTGVAHGDISIHAPRMGSDRENGHLRPRYGQNHPFSTLIVSQIVVDVLGTVRKSQKTPAH